MISHNRKGRKLWAYPCRMLVLGAAPNEELAKGGAAPLALSPAGGAEERNAGTEREKMRRGGDLVGERRRAEARVFFYISSVFPRRTGPRTDIWASRLLFFSA